MKRAIAAAIVLLLMILTALYGQITVTETIGAIQEKILSIDDALASNDIESALSDCYELLNSWEGYHSRLCLFLQHEHLDPLENVFALLPYYIECGDIVPASAECKLVYTETEHILKTERPALENIF